MYQKCTAMLLNINPAKKCSVKELLAFKISQALLGRLLAFVS